MIYLDNAATTKTAPEVVEAMLPYFSEYYGNPSSIYAIAGKSKEAITKGREQIANVLGKWYSYVPLPRLSRLVHADVKSQRLALLP